MSSREEISALSIVTGTVREEGHLEMWKIIILDVFVRVLLEEIEVSLSGIGWEDQPSRK